MKRAGYDFSVMRQNEDVRAASAADVLFSSRGFRSLNIGMKNKDLEVKVDPKMMTMKEAVARETAVMLDQQKRLSVRDLTSKFERGVAAAAKLSNEAKLREAASLEKHVLLKNLRDSLESLKERVAGRNKNEVEEAISLVKTLVTQLNQREGDFIQEKNEVTKLVNLLKQASENAKEFVDEERAFARAEIEKAREAVQRVEEAIQEHECISSQFENQDLNELMNDVHEARRIKMLHEPSKVMDMELELQALRAQLVEKSKKSLLLQKELALSKRRDGTSSNLYQLDGPEVLGSFLKVQLCSDQALDLSICSIQWYRLCTTTEGTREIISGATKPIYAAEPFDVGKILQVDILSDGLLTSLTSAGPIDPAPGLGSYVEALVRRHDNEFNVVITQMNGLDHSSESIHILHVGKMRMKLCKGQGTIAKEYYSPAMLICGVRGGGNAPAQALFWEARRGLNFVLAFESERERNAAIMLARRFAFDTNVVLCGPDDRCHTT